MKRIIISRVPRRIKPEVVQEDCGFVKNTGKKVFDIYNQNDVGDNGKGRIFMLHRTCKYI